MANVQRDVPVDRASVARLARCAIRRLRIRTPGTMAITFIGPQAMRALNRRFLRHDRPTDVLSFRYNGKGVRPFLRGKGSDPMIGEILIAPSLARAYARRHRVPYAEELARYVIHGLLHWLGHEDRTVTQRRRMRSREDRLLARCGVPATG